MEDQEELLDNIDIPLVDLSPLESSEPMVSKKISGVSEVVFVVNKLLSELLNKYVSDDYSKSVINDVTTAISAVANIKKSANEYYTLISAHKLVQQKKRELLESGLTISHNHLEYLYILREREFLNLRNPIYKIGKTRQEPNSRLSGYPKGSEIYAFV